jgi:hypothetical protein
MHVRGDRPACVGCSQLIAACLMAFQSIVHWRLHGVPIGCRSPRKRGPYSMPNDSRHTASPPTRGRSASTAAASASPPRRRALALPRQCCAPGSATGRYADRSPRRAQAQDLAYASHRHSLGWHRSPRSSFPDEQKAGHPPRRSSACHPSRGGRLQIGRAEIKSESVADFPRNTHGWIAILRTNPGNVGLKEFFS